MGPSQTGTTTRRRVLGGLLALPLVGLAVGVAATAHRGIAAMRPGARGTSAMTCAQCGGVDHGMLDTACPAAPRVV